MLVSRVQHLIFAVRRITRCGYLLIVLNAPCAPGSDASIHPFGLFSCSRKRATSFGDSTPGMWYIIQVLKKWGLRPTSESEMHIGREQKVLGSPG